jgi:2-octaprenyl-6-methoxyphenol hydroxylase
MQSVHFDTAAETHASPYLDCDIAILGGGIVGTLFAALLKDSGLKILIFEVNTSTGALARERGYALSPLSGEIFQKVGIWNRIFPHIGKYRHIYLSDADNPHLVKFKPTDLGTAFLGYVGEHTVLLQALQDFIVQECSRIQMICSAQTAVVESGAEGAVLDVFVEGRSQQIRAKLVIGADGARSQIREWAGIRTRGWKYWQSCVTFMISHTAPTNDIAFERFWPNGPIGVLPLTGNRCHIVWTAPHTEARAIQAMDEAAFLKKLSYYTGGFLGDLTLTSDRFLFPVQLYQCDRYVLPRLALIGDAAHRCHPVAGQGLNLGIRDAAALAEVIMEAQRRGEDIGSLAVLKRYECWRQPENLAILGFTDFLDRFFSNNWWILVQVRRLGLWLLRHSPPLKIFALKLMTGFIGRRPLVN